MGRLELSLPRETLSENRGLLVLLTGPTGVGKDASLNALKLPHQKIVTYTSRYQGTNEINGIDYHFVTPFLFEEMIEQEKMFEYYQNSRGDYYGTSNAEIEIKRNSGLVVWRLNPDGVFNLLDHPEKRKFIEPFAIICLVADLDILARRVKERGREKGLSIVERIKQAHGEIFLIERKVQAEKENEEIARRFEAIYDERIFFHNATGWVDNQELVPNSRVAVRVIENKQGLDHPDGFPRTIRLIEETITSLKNLWTI